MPSRCVSKQTLQRLPTYLSFLRTRSEDASKYVSATAIADRFGMNQVVVRKDLASISTLRQAQGGLRPGGPDPGAGALSGL